MQCASRRSCTIVRCGGIGPCPPCPARPPPRHKGCRARGGKDLEMRMHYAKCPAFRQKAAAVAPERRALPGMEPAAKSPFPRAASAARDAGGRADVCPRIAAHRAPARYVAQAGRQNADGRRPPKQRSKSHAPVAAPAPVSSPSMISDRCTGLSGGTTTGSRQVSGTAQAVRNSIPHPRRMAATSAWAE